MSEKEFNEELIKFCKKVVSQIKKEDKSISKSENADHLFVGSSYIYTGSMPWWDDKKDYWHWHQFQRQIDLVIGIKTDKLKPSNENNKQKEMIIPLIACELKLSTNVNTAELDKKSAIYGPLRELYPWSHSVLIFKEANRDREQSILRNGRHFNTIYTEWDKETKKLFKDLIKQQLQYQLGYWNI